MGKGMRPFTPVGRTLFRRSLLVALVVALVAVLPAATPVAAQTDEPEAVIAADWVPFLGTYAVGCTRTNPANPGCPVHHPTWAIDLAIPSDTKIRAAGAGVVIGVGRGCAPNGGDGECNGGAGNIVIIEHGDYSSRYLHLSSIPNRIKVGRVVEAGDVIGRSGASGTFGGAHLHYDEYQFGSPRGRVAFGSMFACHGEVAVLYPEVLGYDAWDLVPPGTVVRNDNYDCTGHPPQPHPPAPELPIYPKGPPLGLGGANAVAVGDFDGDGDNEVAVGSPGGRIDGLRTGHVTLTDPDDPSDTITLAQGGSLEGLSESGDRLGTSLATGDFDCDGLDDLAVGAPGEDLEAPFTDSGAVNVRYGDGTQQLLFSGSVVPSYYRRPSDWFGAVLVVGDFGGDGCDDLAVASPGADRSGGLDMGLVWMLRGSVNGLGRPYRLLQGINFGGVLENRDQTGYALTAGDFDCDGRDDLAAGVPREVLEEGRGGAVMVAYGTASGFRRGEALYRGKGLPGEPVDGELVGLSLAAGDIDGDGCDDLAVGAPNTKVGTRMRAGSVLVVFGHEGRLSKSERSVELAAGSGLPSGPRWGDQLGSAVAIADLNCNGRADLVVGVPNRGVRNRDKAGTVFVVPGRGRGLANESYVINQRRGLKGRPQAGGKLGSALSVGDVNDDGCADLLISAPGATVSGKERAGAVHVWFGSRRKRKQEPAIRLDDRRSSTTSPVTRATFGGASAGDLLRKALKD